MAMAEASTENHGQDINTAVGVGTAETTEKPEIAVIAVTAETTLTTTKLTTIASTAPSAPPEPSVSSAQAASPVPSVSALEGTATVEPTAPIPTTTATTTTVTDEQWRAMKKIIEALYEHREPDGHDPSKVFHRRVNKRALPDYYDVIKEPVALSTLKPKLAHRLYKSFAEFVRDCALIPHNAQTYNRPEAGAYLDAVTIRELMQKEFQKLVEQNIITQEVATLPDLGEIPPASPRPAEDEEDDEDEDDEDEEDEDADDSDEDTSRRKKKRGPRSQAAIKREGGAKDDGQKSNDVDQRKRRGRPPRVDTPMEARIKAVLKGIRKYKNEAGQIMVHQFEKLPDKATMPEYYQEVKEPIAIELIKSAELIANAAKKKQKRKKYQSVDHFMKDIDTMFNNAKSYNEDESQIHQEAEYLQKEARKLVDLEKKKPDTEYVMEEGRLPLPNGISHNGQIWKVGDWVHIQNPNDVTKPIVAQIYRTWQDTEGQKWVNACWYYRPEQTVHQHEKHFFPNEVVKTGQYRDHHIDEVVDRCFVMFTTRYSRGRPRGFATDKEVYVCDSRYNEEKHKLNKIKTWASCLPDEVRDKDYEMDLFEGQKRVKKVPSPLLHMLKEGANEADESPKPRWGVDNAPPIVGAVHKGPRDENQSPPPEPTPSPPPQPPPPPARQVSNVSNHETPSYRRASDAEGTSHPSGPAPSTSRKSFSQSNVQAPMQRYPQQSASPAPVHQQQHGQLATPTYPQSNHSVSQPSPQLDHYATPAIRYSRPQPSQRPSNLPGTGIPPRPSEVYHLSDLANASIPEDIRKEFQRDDQGHVLFFTTPPLDVLPPAKRGSPIGHTAAYLAAKIRRRLGLKEGGMPNEAPSSGSPQEPASKKPKHSHEADPSNFDEQVNQTKIKALEIMIAQLDQGTEAIYKDLYGEHWAEGMKCEQEKLAAAQRERQQLNSELAESARKRKEREKGMVSLRGTGVYLDDIDPRY